MAKVKVQVYSKKKIKKMFKSYNLYLELCQYMHYEGNILHMIRKVML